MGLSLKEKAILRSYLYKTSATWADAQNRTHKKAPDVTIRGFSWAEN